MSESNNDNDSDEAPTYTVDLNGKRYELNEDIRRAIQERAKREYAGNYQFSCWWKVARRADYDDEDWAENVHEDGDPILVIETTGPMVPWERLDQLGVEMQESPESDSRGGDGDSRQDNDHGNGMSTLPPDAVDSPSESDEQESDRTHFDITPHDYEELPSPDGEDENKVPQKPDDFDEPTMVKWVPEHPEIEHTWGAGEAITSMSNWVEWNVQQYANQPRPVSDKSNGHDHWESLVQSHDCEQVGSWETNQDVPKKAPGEREAKDAKDDIGGKFGGKNWNI